MTLLALVIQPLPEHREGGSLQQRILAWGNSGQIGVLFGVDCEPYVSSTPALCSSLPVGVTRAHQLLQDKAGAYS